MIVSGKEFSTEKIKEAFITEIDVYDSDDPRSLRYIRKYNRPVIHWWAIYTSVIIVACLIFMVFIICKKLVNIRLAIGSSVVFLLLILTLFGKSIAITLVKIYQCYAPVKIRKRCRFEPSCSEYSLQAFEKYGFFKGMLLTIKRLHRCNPSGGGFDYLK